MSDIFAELGLRHVINACGASTPVGASPVAEEVVEAVAGILPHNVQITDLHRVASEVIVEATGAEAGCITSCAASGIALSVAACMTGDDLHRIESLPDAAGMRDEIILQKGHAIDYSGNLTQMIRLAGATPVEVGAVNSAGSYQVIGAAGPQTAAGLYVISGQAVHGGMLDLPSFIAACRQVDLPVIIDAATDFDIRPVLAQGAELVIQSSHKYLAGVTAGIVAGRRDLVRAVYMQERGIGRAMKVGREGIVGAIGALRRWGRVDHDALHRTYAERIGIGVERLKGHAGLRISTEADVTGKPVSALRVDVDAAEAGLSADQLARQLADGDPSIQVEDYSVEQGFFTIEPSCLRDGEMELICETIGEMLKAPRRAPVNAPVPNYTDYRHEQFRGWPDTAATPRRAAE